MRMLLPSKIAPASRHLFAPFCAALLLSVAGSAVAAEALQPEPLDFDIPAQGLQAALVKYADQAGLQLALPAQIGDGLKVSGIQGRYTRADALDRLLAGSGFGYQVTDNTLTLEPARIAAEPAAPVPAETQAPPAQAQESGAIEEITVTARRVEEKLQQIPVAVTAVTEAALSQMSIHEMRDLSAVAPNLNIKQSSNDGQSALVSIRGQLPAGVLLTTDSAVGIYVDGINNPRANGFRSALVDVARVEVLRGPQGTLYGRNTTGGAISVITNAPTDKFEGSVSLTGGNYDSINGVGIVNLPLSDEIAMRLVAQRAVHTGYGRDFDGKDLADEDSTYLRGKLRFQNDALSAVLSTDYQSDKTGGPIFRLSGLTQYTTPVGGPATREVTQELGLAQTPENWAIAAAQLQQYVYDGHGNAYRSGLQDSYSDFTGNSSGLDVNWTLSDTLSLRSLTGYRHTRRRNLQDIDSTPFSILTVPYKVDDDFYSEELQILGNLGSVNFVGGLFGSYEDGYETSAPGSLAALTAAAGRSLYSTQGGFVKSSSYAAFGQANWKATDQLTLTLGLRYTTDIKELTAVSHTNQDYISDPLPSGAAGCSIPASLLKSPELCRAGFKDTFSDPSWLTSADYKLTEDMLVYAKVARGFRAGGENLRGLNAIALQPFGPETITEYEAGFKADFLDKRARFNLALFHDDYSGVQRTVSLFNGSTTTTLVSNAAQANIDGVEVESILRLTQRITLSANIGYTDARYVKFVDATGDRSDEDWPTPDWTYALSARYGVPLSTGELAFQADYQGQSKQNLYPAVAKQPEDVTQDAYGLLNARISYTHDAADLEVSIFGRNLLDEVYAESGLSTEGLGTNFLNIGEPRTYGVQLVKKF
ncbi:MAG: hypothetical protein JWQ90_2474 [Hydrocarboniphaga sp.]|uniref:TonB-dependent receptor domain-containing protein n=1 Tax=Hydrocarboniphaga sp. TaxID=2033016 RepID=UPI0026064FD9|nr:TonB-dependent receptor [Hydrocarboniphaga sp.]MDB5970024.1 hypothetical protein [Hydrocarboniphaga sp.]